MHPLHLGVLHMDIQANGRATIQVRLFTDDLENGIYHLFNKKMKVVPGQAEAEKHVRQYIEQKLKIQQNSKPLDVDFVSMKKDKDVTELEYRFKLESEKSMQICCNVFFELFRDQTNLLIINFDGKEDGFRLTPNRECINVEK